VGGTKINAINKEKGRQEVVGGSPGWGRKEKGTEKRMGRKGKSVRLTRWFEEKQVSRKKSENQNPHTVAQKKLKKTGPCVKKKRCEKK